MSAMVKSEPSENFDDSGRSKSVQDVNSSNRQVSNTLPSQNSQTILNTPNDIFVIKEEYQATEFDDLEQAISQFEHDYSDTENSDVESTNLADQEQPSTSRRKRSHKDAGHSADDDYEEDRLNKSYNTKNVPTTATSNDRPQLKRTPRLRKTLPKIERSMPVLQRILPMGDGAESYMQQQPSGQFPFNTDVHYNTLFNLLSCWNLLHLMDYLKAENIDMNVLLIATKDDLNEITQKMKIGDRILFKYHFEKWKAENKECRYDASFMGPSLSNSSPQSSDNECELEKANIKPNLDMDCEKERGKPKIRAIDILKQHINGCLILENYKKVFKITEEQRNMLISIIVQHFETKNIKMTMQMSRRLENEILQLFPTEKLEFYRTGMRGKIYVKYHNNYRKIVKSLNCGARTIRQMGGGGNSNNSAQQISKKLVPEEDASVHVQNLKSENLSHQEFISAWDACAKYRINQIHYECKTINEALTLWPQYKGPNGFQLIDNDFYIITGNLTTITEWRDKFKMLHEFVRSYLKTRERDIKDIAMSIDKDGFDNDMGSFILKILWCLHPHLNPTKKYFRINKNGEKELLRHSTKDSQESFIYINETMPALEQHIQNLLINRSEQIPPFILGLGEPNTLNANIFYVYLDGHLMTFNNFARAFDICFKLFHIFNVEYPLAASTFWMFVEKFIYGFKRSDKENSKVCILIDELSKMENIG